MAVSTYKTVVGVGLSNGRKVVGDINLLLDKQGVPDYSATIVEAKRQLLAAGSIPQRILILVV